jgi:hypothetical protein
MCDVGSKTATPCQNAAKMRFHTSYMCMEHYESRKPHVRPENVVDYVVKIRELRVALGDSPAGPFGWGIVASSRETLTDSSEGSDGKLVTTASCAVCGKKKCATKHLTETKTGQIACLSCIESPPQTAWTSCEICFKCGKESTDRGCICCGKGRHLKCIRDRYDIVCYECVPHIVKCADTIDFEQCRLQPATMCIIHFHLLRTTAELLDDRMVLKYKADSKRDTSFGQAIANALTKNNFFDVDELLGPRGDCTRDHFNAIMTKTAAHWMRDHSVTLISKGTKIFTMQKTIALLMAKSPSSPQKSQSSTSSASLSSVSLPPPQKSQPRFESQHDEAESRDGERDDETDLCRTKAGEGKTEEKVIASGGGGSGGVCENSKMSIPRQKRRCLKSIQYCALLPLTRKQKCRKVVRDVSLLTGNA